MQGNPLLSKASFWKFFDLKIANVLLIYKNDDVDNKENYHPVSSLSNFSKIFERLIQNLINQYMKKLSEVITGFRKCDRI